MLGLIYCARICACASLMGIINLWRVGGGWVRGSTYTISMRGVCVGGYRSRSSVFLSEFTIMYMYICVVMFMVRMVIGDTHYTFMI